MKKPKLLELTKSVRTEKLYLVDDIEIGHDALHLPLYHPSLNPNKLVWRDIKNKSSTRMNVYEFEGKPHVLQKVFTAYTTKRK
jgi:hypothetical protein